MAIGRIKEAVAQGANVKLDGKYICSQGYVGGVASFRRRVFAQTFPTWEVVKAEPDYCDPREIRVKVSKPLPKESRIRVKGNAIASGWSRMIMPWYWIGERKYRIIQANDVICNHMVRVKAKVRVYELEEKHREEIQSQKRKKVKEAKKHG